jgi:hypothetical protein
MGAGWEGGDGPLDRQDVALAWHAYTKAGDYPGDPQKLFFLTFLCDVGVIVEDNEGDPIFPNPCFYPSCLLALYWHYVHVRDRQHTFQHYVGHNTTTQRHIREYGSNPLVVAACRAKDWSAAAYMALHLVKDDVASTAHNAE